MRKAFAITSVFKLEHKLPSEKFTKDPAKKQQIKYKWEHERIVSINMRKENVFRNKDQETEESQCKTRFFLSTET